MKPQARRGLAGELCTESCQEPRRVDKSSKNRREIGTGEGLEREKCQRPRRAPGPQGINDQETKRAPAGVPLPNKDGVP